MEMNSIKIKENIAVVENSISLDLHPEKRVLHFSDGILEEFSDSDIDENQNEKISTKDILENDLTWGPWLLHKTAKAGSTVLAGCDYVGEALASFLGITTPKYDSQIKEFQRIQEENEKLAKEKEEHASWQEKRQLNGNDPITKEFQKDEKF